jgi:hypothetical protein
MTSNGSRFRAALAAALMCFAHGCSGGATSTPASQGLVIKNGYPDRPYFHDFGRIAYGSRVEFVFEVENTDPVPVVVQDMKPSCGCVTPRISYTAADGKVVEGALTGDGPVITLPRGALARVAMKIDTTRVQRMNTDKLEQVRLRSDSAVTPYMTLEMHMVVERLIRSVPASIDLGLVPQSYGKGARADLSTEVAGSPARILRIESIDGPLTANLDSTQQGDEPYWILTLEVKPNQPLGTVKGNVKLSTTGPDGTGTGFAHEVPVIGQVVPDIVIEPGVLIFRAAEPGSLPRAEATVAALVPGERVLVRTAELEGTDSEHLRVEATPIDPDENGRATQWKLVIEALEPLRDRAFNGSVNVVTDHARVPSVRAPYSRAP